MLLHDLKFEVTRLSSYIQCMEAVHACCVHTVLNKSIDSRHAQE